MAVAAPGGALLAANPALKAMLGVEHPDLRVLGLDREVVSGDLTGCSGERPYRRPDGSTGWLEVHVSVAQDPAGGTGYLVCQALDVTERRLRWEGLRQMSHELEGANEALGSAIAHASVNAARQRALIDHLPDTAVYLYDHDHRVTVAAGAALSWRGVTADELVGKRPGDLLPAADAATLDGMIDAAFAGSPVSDEVLVAPLGREVLLDLVPIRPERDQPPSEVLVVARDISDRKARERALAAARQDALVEHSSDLILITDRRGRIVYASPACERLTGWGAWEVIDRSVTDLVAAEDPDYTDELRRALLGGATVGADISCQVLRRDGDRRHVEVTAVDRLKDPAVRGIVVHVRDVTERVRTAERLAHQALHDALTDLPNRSLLLDRLEQALVRGERRQSSTGVLVIDLDHFKGVNDSLGHAAGDRVLTAVADRLRAAVRPGDTVARLGSDEFAVLTEELPDPERALEIAERLRAAVTEPIDLDGERIIVGCSAGIAVAGQRGREALLQQADIALYRAKERGRNRSELYDLGMHAAARRRHDTEQVVRHALDHGGIRVLHQPIVDLASGRVTGTEALVRISTSTGGMLPPNDFIPVAEDTGLIIPLGAAVLDRACAQQSAWRGAPGAPGAVSVNVSARQLLQAAFADDVAAALDRHGLHPDQLCLELTESALIDAGPVVEANVGGLRELGVALALDDFGTGWSSLAYLRRFPIDVLKIDRAFVSGLGADARDTEVVRAIIGLAHGLSLTAVAEGVEEPAQEELLVELGCDRAQGYRYGRPRPPEDLSAGWPAPAS
jgi:diguanylate cyclase (GGDEF)-like protein/PAS domain S-box-containing protein